MFKILQRDLGNGIRVARKVVGLSQEALALAADVDRSYVSQLERGVANPSLGVLLRVAEILECQLKVTLEHGKPSMV